MNGYIAKPIEKAALLQQIAYGLSVAPAQVEEPGTAANGLDGTVAASRAR